MDKPATVIPRSSSKGKKGPPPMGKKGPPPMGKKATLKTSDGDDPVKRSVALLKSAGIEAAKVKAGDASAGPEAVRQYTEGLILLQEAIDSGNYNEKVCESLNKKAKGVRKRIKDLGGNVPSGSSPNKPAVPRAVNFKEDASSPPSKAGSAPTEDEMAAEVKQWTRQTVKALKASPVHAGIELTGARLTVCTKGDLYTIAEAGHHKGKLAFRLEEPGGWVAAKAKSGSMVFKVAESLPPTPAPAPEPEPQPAPAPAPAPAQPAMAAALEDEDPDGDGSGSAAAQAAAAKEQRRKEEEALQHAQEQAAAAAAKQEQEAAAAAAAKREQEAAAAAAVAAAAKATSAAIAAAAPAPVAAVAPTPESLPVASPAALGLPPVATAPRPSAQATAGGRVDTAAIEAQTRAQMQPLSERLTVSMRLLCSKRPAEPYAFLATAFRSPDDAKSEPARSAPATDADGGEQTLVAYLESHSVIRNMRGALELCLRQDPPLATEQALQFVATELAKLAR